MLDVATFHLLRGVCPFLRLLLLTEYASGEHRVHPRLSPVEARKVCIVKVQTFPLAVRPIKIIVDVW